MTAQRKVETFNTWSRFMTLALALVRGCVWALPVSFVGLLALAGLDHFLDIPSWGRQILWVFVFALALYGLVNSFFPSKIFSLSNRSTHLSSHRRSQKIRVDDLRIAVEFLKKRDHAGISSELKNEFLEEFAQKLSSASISDCFPNWNWKKSVVIGLIVFSIGGTVGALFPAQFNLGPRVLFPFGSNRIDQVVRVMPGDARVPWGGTVEIKISVLIKTLDKPVLMVRAHRDWLPVKSEKEVKGTQIYVFKNVVEPLTYRVQWRKDWGRKYVIRPFRPIEPTQFDVTLRQPEYVGGQILTQNTPELSGLPGSQVELKATVSEPLEEAKILFSDGSQKKMTLQNKNTIAVSFPLFRSGTYGFYLKTEAGQVAERNDQYPIHVRDDGPPLVRLISPEEDLVVGDKETIPITFTAEDDFGLHKAHLVWQRRGKTKKGLRKSYPLGTENTLDTFEWDLNAERFSPGDLIKYRVEVTDQNRVTGPGVATTEWRLIEIASFEKGHEEIEQALEMWRDEILTLLAEVNTMKAKTEAEKSDLTEITPDFNRASQKGSQLERALKKIVSMMEQDPLADYGVWSEHSAMADNMEAMNKGAMKRAQAALQTKNKGAALSEMEKVSAELERMVALSEELSKTQRARDIVDAGDDLEELSEDLMKQLESAASQDSPLNKEQRNEINRLLQEAQEILQDIARQMQKFPDELPEDFINQEALKDLNVKESQDILSQIQDAMKRGDMKAALNMAQQFLDMAQKMREQLNEAHESYLEENSAAEMGEQISAEQKKLDALMEKQRDILAETQKLESKRLAAMLKEQEKALQALVEEQKKAVEAMRGVVAKKFEPSTAVPQLTVQLRSMVSVLSELEAGRLDKSPTLLVSIIETLERLKTEIKSVPASRSIADQVDEIRTQEKQILEKIQQPVEPKSAFGPQDKNKFDQLKSKQEELQKKTKALRQKLQRLSQKTASLGVSLTQSLDEAGSRMNEASENLGGQKSQPAQRAEEKALSSLQAAQNALQQAQNAMQQMGNQGQGSGKGKGSGGQPKAMSRAKKRGSSGLETGKVRLPKADEYKAPKEFREELLESLREKFPEIYEGIIHKYFKRLSE